MKTDPYEVFKELCQSFINNIPKDIDFKPALKQIKAEEQVIANNISDNEPIDSFYKLYYSKIKEN